MSISSSDSTDSDSDIENYIMCCAIADHAEQVARENRLLSLQPQHTSRPGMAWVVELLWGHRMRMYESMRFYPETFHRLIEVIRQNNLLSSKGRITRVPVMESVNFFFLIRSPGWEGTAHNSKVLENAILDPLAKFSFQPHDKYYVVDAGLRNTKGFLAPYKGTLYHLQDYRGSDREPKNGKELVNYRHASLRNVIERTFGAWKSRFRILRQGMNNYDFNTQVKIVIACAVLHNFLRELQSGDGIFTEYEHDDTDVDETEQQSTQSSNTTSSFRSSDREMHARREEIVCIMWENYITE
uniref:DDE Tnp4 domain-containing protein n=1 Tax=Nicotiana tabacum TaxID=4097 RepID=A0A1S4DQR4_TOBAC|nr:PREDICTED: uncharacterized protein LOC107832428 [Nicotiana tabacum]